MCIGIMLLALLVASCGTGTEFSNNNYLNFEVIDVEQGNFSTFVANELYMSTFSESGYNIYTPITKSYSAPYQNVSLGGGDGDSISVTLNNTKEYILNTSSLVESGFYVDVNPSSMYLPNNNAYQINLDYQNNTYYGLLSNIPYIYTINNTIINPNCTTNGTSLGCTVPTTNSVGVLTNAGITYILNASSASTCTGVLAKSIPYSDTVTFASCKISSLTPTIQLQIAYNVLLTNVKNETPGGRVNLQGLYYFVSKAVTIAQ